MHAQVANAQKASAVAAEKLSNLQHASKSCDVVDVNCDAIQGAHKKVIEAIEKAEQLHAEAADLKAKEAQLIAATVSLDALALSTSPERPVQTVSARLVTEVAGQVEFVMRSQMKNTDDSWYPPPQELASPVYPAPDASVVEATASDVDLRGVVSAALTDSSSWNPANQRQAMEERKHRESVRTARGCSSAQSPFHTTSSVRCVWMGARPPNHLVFPGWAEAPRVPPGRAAEHPVPRDALPDGDLS
jgi:hypothetical protein